MMHRVVNQFLNNASSGHDRLFMAIEKLNYLSVIISTLQISVSSKVGSKYLQDYYIVELSWLQDRKLHTQMLTTQMSSLRTGLIILSR